MIQTTAAVSSVSRFAADVQPHCIRMRGINKWYGNLQVLKDCSTHVSKGEIVVVCGPSGSGKSTLIKTVNGLESFQKGEILVNGQSIGSAKTDLPKLRQQVGMVFQHFELFPHMSIIENLTLPQTKAVSYTHLTLPTNREV